jgi:hypothetical protein
VERPPTQRSVVDGFDAHQRRIRRINEQVDQAIRSNANVTHAADPFQELFILDLPLVRIETNAGEVLAGETADEDVAAPVREPVT